MSSWCLSYSTSVSALLQPKQASPKFCIGQWWPDHAVTKLASRCRLRNTMRAPYLPAITYAAAVVVHRCRCGRGRGIGWPLSHRAPAGLSMGPIGSTSLLCRPWRWHSALMAGGRCVPDLAQYCRCQCTRTRIRSPPSGTGPSVDESACSRR